MPVIDLKNVTVYFEDGTSKAGIANASSGPYVAGCTTIPVASFTGDIPVGARLSMGGNDIYQASAVGLIGGNAANITFTPGLLANLANSSVITVYGVFIKIKVGEGTLTWTEKKPREYKLDRGKLDSVRNGDETPMEVAINLMYEAVTAASGDPPTPEDVLKQRGAAASWLSTEVSDPCAPYCINIRLDHQPPNCIGFPKERVILPYFRYEDLPHDPKAGTINATGKCNALEAIVTRIP